MILTLEQWKEILDTINPNKDDIVEAIKKELNKQDHNTYQEWEEKNFNLDHLIKMLGTELSFELLRIATMNSHKDLVIALLENGAKVDEKGKNDECTALHFAVKNGYIDVVEALLDKKASVNSLSIFGTPLNLAAEQGHKEIVEALLNKGADVNLQDNDRKTPLHLAIRKGNENIVKVLLDKGANVNLQDNDRKTPLHLAAEQGHKEIVEILLEKEVDVNVKGVYGNNTPLHLAAKNGRKDVVIALLENGANPLDLVNRLEFNQKIISKSTKISITLGIITALTVNIGYYIAGVELAIEAPLLIGFIAGAITFCAILAIATLVTGVTVSSIIKPSDKLDKPDLEVATQQVNGIC
ncbi:MAG: ankyrin repeat domain-containing protein [Wolbachia pipientis]